MLGRLPNTLIVIRGSKLSDFKFFLDPPARDILAFHETN